ncbi:hypothetical protein C0992_007938 [Termitomyces sp. T32_za158]|nr:hypothetical protein C0992_007938 [Termitomyces sp. T32_za158]
MINDDESDLTEIEDSEDEQPLASKCLAFMPPPPQPLKKQSPPHKVEEKTEKKRLRSGPRLDEPHLYADTVQTIYHELKNKIIDVDPEYQRSVVWDDAKQGYLIDSLMNNYVVFPLVFAERTREEDDVKIKVCIDGKQRITAIQQFRDGKISYRDSQLNHDMWYAQVPAGKKGIAFTAAQRQRFDNSRISICKYPSIEEYDEREVFQRVQNGVALSTHERLKAVNGPNGDLVREMYRRTSTGLRESLGWEKAKGKDFFMLSQMAIIIKESIVKKPPASQITLSRVETFLNLKIAPTKELLSSVLAVIEDFNSIYENPQLVDVFQNIQPQFFVMAGVMIHLHRKTLSVAQLADAVRQMKKVVKVNTAAKLYKELLTFVMVEVLSLKLKGPSLSASHRAPTTSVTKSVSAPEITRALVPSASIAPEYTETAQTTPKRKRATKGDNDDNSPEAIVPVTKRRKVPPLKLSDYNDEDNDDSPVVRRNPPKAPVTPRPPISVVAKASGSISKAQTKVKSKTTTATPKLTTSKSTPRTEMERPSRTTPSTSARARNSMTAGAVTMFVAQDKSVGSQQKEALPVRKYIPTPADSTPSSLAPVPSLPPSASAPASRPPSSHHASQLFDEPRPSSTGCDTNSRHSLSISSPSSSSAPSTRLGPIIRAKQLIKDHTSSHAPRSRQPSHQLVQQSQPSTSKDHEANLQFQLDQIGNALRSPMTSARASANTSNPLSPLQQQRPRTPAVLSPGDVSIAHGTGDKESLHGMTPIQRKDNPVPARKPLVQEKPVGHSSVPSIESSRTNVEANRFENTPASTSTSASAPAPSANGNKDEPQSAVPSAATTLSEQKISYRQMPPIPKRSTQATPNPAVPKRTLEAQPGTRVSASRNLSYRDHDFELRHYRPPGNNLRRERSRR